MAMAKKRKRSKQSTKIDTPHATPPRAEAKRPATDAGQTRAERTAAQPAGVLDNALFALALVGVVLTLYLTLTAWFGEHPAFCNADSSCDLVQSSRWSKFLSLPMSLWGFVTYAVLARSICRLRTRPSAWRFTILVAFVGVGVSWFLTAVSIVYIEATCIYCLASVGIINLLLVLLILRRPAHLDAHQWSKVLPSPVAITIAVVLGLHLHFSGLFDPAAGPEDPYLKGLAIHLSERGAIFYGAYWCPHCQEQKALFEASVDRLPYVECTPDGRRGSVSRECRDANISDYPTWVINKRRVGGAVAPKELARLSGYHQR
jgi:uncharacterized membrane protein